MTKLKRLLDEPGSDLDRILLEAGLDEAPPAKSIDRTLAAIGVGSALTLGASASATATATTTATASGVAQGVGKAGGMLGVSMAKWIGGAVLAVGAIGGYVGLRATDTSAPPAQTAPVAAAVAASASQEPSGLRPVARGELATSPPAEQSAATPPPDAAASSAPVAEASAVPRADSAQLTTAEKAKPTARSEEPARTSTTSTAAPKATSAPVATSKPQAATEEPASGAGLTGEIAMLDSARKALAANDFDGCQARLATYASRYPKGQLAQDAAGIRAALKQKRDAAATTP